MPRSGPLRDIHRHRWRALGVPVLCVTLAACGADRVETVAREGALDRLQTNLTEAVGCLTSVAPQVDPTLGPDVLPNVLAPCGEVEVLNKDDAFIWSDQVEFGIGDGSIIVSGTIAGERVTLGVVSQGSGVAKVGVTEARVQLVTCWQVTIDSGAGALEDYADITCRESVLKQLFPTDVVPLSDLEIPNTASATGGGT